MTIKSRRKKINIAYKNQYTFEAMVHGYHVYHKIWAAAVEDNGIVLERGSGRLLASLTG